MNPTRTAQIIGVDSICLQSKFDLSPRWIGRMVFRQCFTQSEYTMLQGQPDSALLFKPFGKHVMNMMYEQLKADLCLYFAWKDDALVTLVSWVDDAILLGPPSAVKMFQQYLEQAFKCKHKGKHTK